MTDPRIVKLRQWAEKDLRLSDCAMRLLFRIYSDRVLSSAPVSEAFDLPWKQVAWWCGLSDQMNCYARLCELVGAGYIYYEGVRGCPPTNFYKLNLKLDLQKMVKAGLDGSFRDGVIPPTSRRLGNKDAATRKGFAAMRSAVK